MVTTNIYSFLSCPCVQDLPFTCRTFFDQIPILNQILQPSVGGIVVSIAAFQAVDPGSIPGHRMLNPFSSISPIHYGKGDQGKLQFGRLGRNFPIFNKSLGSSS